MKLFKKKRKPIDPEIQSFMDRMEEYHKQMIHFMALSCRFMIRETQLSPRRDDMTKELLYYLDKFQHELFVLDDTILKNLTPIYDKP